MSKRTRSNGNQPVSEDTDAVDASASAGDQPSDHKRLKTGVIVPEVIVPDIKFNGLGYIEIDASKDIDPAVVAKLKTGVQEADPPPAGYYDEPRMSLPTILTFVPHSLNP